MRPPKPATWATVAALLSLLILLGVEVARASEDVGDQAEEQSAVIGLSDRNSKAPPAPLRSTVPRSTQIIGAWLHPSKMSGCRQ